MIVYFPFSAISLGNKLFKMASGSSFCVISNFC